MGGGNQPERRAHRPRAAHPLHFAFLDGAQQLGLEVGLEVADFVEEQSAAVGQLELADALLNGAGERAFLVAEQRAFHQLARDRREVDRHKRRVGVDRLAMQQARQQFLAGAALAEHQHGGRQLGDLVHRLEHLLERGARAGDEVARRGIARGVLQREHVAIQVLALAGVADQRAEHVGVGVLGQEVVGAEFDGADRRVDVGPGRGHDYLDYWEVLADDLEKVEPAERRQLHVGDQHVDFFPVHQRQTRFRGRGANDAVVAP